MHELTTRGHNVYKQGRWSLMRKGAHLRTQYFSLKLGKGWFCAPKFWPLLSDCAPNFEQVPPPLVSKSKVNLITLILPWKSTLDSCRCFAQKASVTRRALATPAVTLRKTGVKMMLDIWSGAQGKTVINLHSDLFFRLKAKAIKMNKTKVIFSKDSAP